MAQTIASISEHMKVLDTLLSALGVGPTHGKPRIELAKQTPRAPPVLGMSYVEVSHSMHNSEGEIALRKRRATLQRFTFRKEWAPWSLGAPESQ